MRHISVTMRVAPKLATLAIGVTIATALQGFAQTTQNACPKELFPIHEHDQVDTFFSPTEPLPGRKMELSGKVCSDAEQYGRYHIRSAKVWIPTWQLRTTGPQNQLQPSPSMTNESAVPFAAPLAEAPPKGADAPSLALSPSSPMGESATAPVMNQPSKLKDLLRKEVEPSSAK
jgi:hypothetical protein